VFANSRATCARLMEISIAPEEEMMNLVSSCIRSLKLVRDAPAWQGRNIARVVER